MSQIPIRKCGSFLATQNIVNKALYFFEEVLPFKKDLKSATEYEVVCLFYL